MNKEFDIFKKRYFFKKYLLSWILPLISMILYLTFEKFYLLLILLYCIFIGLLYSRLSYIKLFDKKIIHKNVEISVNQISNLYIINQKSSIFYVFKTNSSNICKRYLITELRGVGMKTLLNLKSFDSSYNKFVETLINNSNIPNNRLKKLFSEYI